METILLAIGWLGVLLGCLWAASDRSLKRKPCG
jgi:hypothetical protein